jgi:UDP-glucose 4-epimerase
LAGREYVSTAALARAIAERRRIKLRQTKLLNPALWLLGKKAAKAFGNWTYEQNLSGCFDWRYCLFDFPTSIEATEQGWEKD